MRVERVGVGVIDPNSAIVVRNEDLARVNCSELNCLKKMGDFSI